MDNFPPRSFCCSCYRLSVFGRTLPLPTIPPFCDHYYHSFHIFSLSWTLSLHTIVFCPAFSLYRLK